MTALSGFRLGPYELQSLIGKGGMGEVYRARDTKLGRDVAVKVLPREFASHPERLARFEREARLLATLNHPHIAGIYGLEEAGDVKGLILELVEGLTLAEWIAAQTLRTSSGTSTREALVLATQIADALDAAHQRGVVHRDLKPENITITSEGIVKVLDFGLAKATGLDSTPADTLDATEMFHETVSGVILGTAPYMSPEQARAKGVDKRTDVWAFGCVLYEMLTGRRAFGGETRSDVLAAILERQPEWSALPPTTPVSIARLVQRCLEKDPRRRLHDIADARIEIEETLARDSETLATTRRGSKLARRAWLGVALAASLLAVAWWGLNRPSPAPPPRPVRFQRITDFVGVEESPAISPDGKTVAFVALAQGRLQIWIRLLAGGLPLQVTHDEANHEHPRWAPDSSSILYYSAPAAPGSDGTLWEVSMLGGQPRRVAAAASGGDISHDGRRIAAFQSRDGRTDLVVLARDGSALQQLANVPEESGGKNPLWSPDDRWLAFSGTTLVGFDDSISIVPANGGSPRRVVHGDTIRGLAWLPDGTGVVFGSSAGSTMLYPPIFNLRTVALDGSGERALTFGDVSYTDPDVHASGRLVASRTRIQSDLWRFTIGGSPADNTRDAVRITRQTGQAQTPSLSPDGREVVFLSDSSGHGNLWIAKTRGAELRQLTFENDPSVVLGAPVWSPAGDRIAYIRTQVGRTEQWLVNADGTHARPWLLRAVAATWSADGRWLYYSAARGGDTCIEKVAVDTEQPVPVRCGRALAPSISADGSTLFFAARLRGTSGWDYEIERAQPESGPAVALARVASYRIPFDSKLFTPTLSPNGSWLAIPLVDGATSNIWLQPTNGGALRRVTDFGERATAIVRRIAWAPDSRTVFAAVADVDSDVVMIDGVLR